MTRRLMLSLFMGVAVLALAWAPRARRANANERADRPFDGAPLPDFREWDGARPPEAKSTQIMLLFQAEKDGRWNAALLDCSEGKVPWDASVDRLQLADLMSDFYKAALVDIGRHPPPPPPVGDDPVRMFELNANAACAGNGPITATIEGPVK
jgi:hypothetical protein